MSALDPTQIAKLLQEETNKPKKGGGSGGTRKGKVDPTATRDIPTWFKLSHHLCAYDCEHRTTSPTGRACWNPKCSDTRDSNDRGTQIVVQVGDVFMCRYCYLDGWKYANS